MTNTDISYYCLRINDPVKRQRLEELGIYTGVGAYDGIWEYNLLKEVGYFFDRATITACNIGYIERYSNNVQELTQDSFIKLCEYVSAYGYQAGCLLMSQEISNETP